ncbi:plasmid stabilization system protein ParE [Flavobacterium nitrogenifigens]|uniref:Plasmid stabilization system protein ParE n=2 Tax=Flavobacterium TaxID=237 RepID=A0A7W7J135_9FLAO|nr:plasmid stabilization system protein ParE [Flavobacterium nitrogenifigens]MBB6389016.1 plasmid stabilization system protein ParE [Flavobacterium notoginsengisoli]
MNVKLTENAEKTFSQIINKYSDFKAAKFSNQTISTIEMILQNNYIGSKYKKTSFRKFLVSNQVYLFYKIEKQTIYIITFWDNKRNPLELDVILSS